MKKIWLGIFLTGFIFLLGFIQKEEVSYLDGEMTVQEALSELGAYDVPNHVANSSIDGASVKRGEDIVKKGFTRKKNGRKSSRISKHFVCTSCHNVEREDPDPSKIDPQARLEYTAELGLPFLQGSPLYGIVNRNAFYNDDYEKKYGDLVTAARNDLRQSIQLCSTECSQGRAMKEWELESVLMYLWTLELKVSDLNIDQEEEKLISGAIDNGGDEAEAAKVLKSKFLTDSPAHFLPPPTGKITRRVSNGNPENGSLIYKNSCLHCHEKRRYSFFNLDDSKGTFRNLKNNLDNFHERSIYQVARYGTSPAGGKKAYMPQYTQEKMSAMQLEDLKAYIIQQAN